MLPDNFSNEELLDLRDVSDFNIYTTVLEQLEHYWCEVEQIFHLDNKPRDQPLIDGFSENFLQRTEYADFPTSHVRSIQLKIVAS